MSIKGAKKENSCKKQHARYDVQLNLLDFKHHGRFAMVNRVTLQIPQKIYRLKVNAT